MQVHIGRIVDVGPGAAPNGRARARLHIVMISDIDQYPIRRTPGEVLCNANMDTSRATATDDTEPTCSKCLVRMDRYDIRIVAGQRHTGTAR